MAVQKKILTEAVPVYGKDPEVIYNGDDSGESGEGTLPLNGKVGALALGKPGDIWSRAYGPLVYAIVSNKDVKFGTLVEPYGVLVNGNDVANESARFEATDTLKAGQTGAFLVSGAAVVECAAVAAIKEKMNARVVYGWDGKSEYAEGDVCAIEVNGFKNPEDIPVPPEEDSESV